MYIKVDNEFVLFVNENDSQEFGIVKKFESIFGHSLFDNSRKIVFAILVFLSDSLSSVPTYIQIVYSGLNPPTQEEDSVVHVCAENLDFV